MLSYSRGALLALLVGLAFWFAVVPLRLRGALPLIAAALVAAPVVAWAFARDALSTERRAAGRARRRRARARRAARCWCACVLLAVGLAVSFVAAQRPPTPRTRRLAGAALVGVLALVPCSRS